MVTSGYLEREHSWKHRGHISECGTGSGRHHGGVNAHCDTAVAAMTSVVNNNVDGQFYRERTRSPSPTRPVDQFGFVKYDTEQWTTLSSHTVGRAGTRVKRRLAPGGYVARSRDPSDEASTTASGLSASEVELGYIRSLAAVAQLPNGPMDAVRTMTGRCVILDNNMYDEFGYAPATRTGGEDTHTLGGAATSSVVVFVPRGRRLPSFETPSGFTRRYAWSCWARLGGRSRSRGSGKLAAGPPDGVSMGESTWQGAGVGR